MKRHRKFLLLDSLSLFFRAYYALPPLGKAGVELEGAYGFTKMLIRALKDTKPTHIFAFFDRGKSGRDSKYEGYKANRPEATENIKFQVRITQEILTSLDVPIVTMEGYEADDLIASFINKASSFGGEVKTSFLVFTGDKDLLGVLKYPDTYVLLVRKGVSEYESYDKVKFEREFGFPPFLYPIYKALLGDPSDNIKGVPSIGKKKGRELIEKAMKLSGCPDCTFEKVKSNIEAILKEKGKDFPEIFKLNLDLVMLHDDIEIPDIEKIIEKGVYTGLDKESFKTKLRELGFKSILRTLGEVLGKAKASQGKLFS